jgi:hypothetical protein
VPTLHEVLVSAVPPDATLARDGQDLGIAPVVLHLADGEVASLTVSHKGYKTKNVTVDPSGPRQTVTLEPAWAPPAHSVKAPASAAPAPRVGGLDDVGDPFAKGH